MNLSEHKVFLQLKADVQSEKPVIEWQSCPVRFSKLFKWTGQCFSIWTVILFSLYFIAELLFIYSLSIAVLFISIIIYAIWMHNNKKTCAIKESHLVSLDRKNRTITVSNGQYQIRQHQLTDNYFIRVECALPYGCKVSSYKPPLWRRGRLVIKNENLKTAEILFEYFFCDDCALKQLIEVADILAKELNLIRAQDYTINKIY
ncbi:hypothetical protein BHC44_10980 [Snodgrassella alvi]|nr:hypothetical protein BHC44_10980 [Snodgrassella alvi]